MSDANDFSRVDPSRRRFLGFAAKTILVVAGTVAGLGATEAHAAGLKAKASTGTMGHIVPSTPQGAAVASVTSAGNAHYPLDLRTQLAKADSNPGKRNLFSVDPAIPKNYFGGSDSHTLQIVGTDPKNDVVILPGNESDYHPSLPTDAEELSGYHNEGDVDLTRTVDGVTERISLHNVGPVVFSGAESPSEIAKKIDDGSSPDGYHMKTMSALNQKAQDLLSPEQNCAAGVLLKERKDIFPAVKNGETEALSSVYSRIRKTCTPGGP